MCAPPGQSWASRSTRVAGSKRGSARRSVAKKDWLSAASASSRNRDVTSAGAGVGCVRDPVVIGHPYDQGPRTNDQGGQPLVIRPSSLVESYAAAPSTT